MRVHRIQRENENDILFELLDDNEEPIAAISGFMRHLHARGCSPNTLAAYIYDLQHFVQFLKEQQLTYQQCNPVHALALLQDLSTLPIRKPSQRLRPVPSTTTTP